MSLKSIILHDFSSLSYIIYKITFFLFGCTVPPSAQLGQRVNFGHPIGIVIHQDAIIGDGTIIYQNVTIGRKDRLAQSCPVVGENCVIGAGACLLGDIMIGNNVSIGANAVVLRSIPDDCIAVGVPAKIYKKNEG